MERITFKQRLEAKINESYEKRVSMENNKEQNKVKLKEQVIKEIEESILSAVPKYTITKNIKLRGSLLFVYAKDNKYCIDKWYGDDMVLFDNFDEIREFIEEVVAEFEGDLKYDMNVYKNNPVNKATIQFEYEYKES